jgi:hypothetical protein
MRSLPDCPHCGAKLYSKVVSHDDVTSSAYAVESDEQAHNIYRCRDLLAIEVKRLRPFDPTPCPTCPSGQGQKAWSTFGPCSVDGKWHRVECPIARKAMAAAKWPCGKWRYPELVVERIDAGLT